MLLYRGTFLEDKRPSTEAITMYMFQIYLTIVFFSCRLNQEDKQDVRLLGVSIHAQ